MVKVIPEEQKLSRRVADLERQVKELRASTVPSVRPIVEALPEVGASTGSTTGFALSSGTNTYLTVTVPVPDGKTQATVMVTGGCAAVDMTSGGVTNASARVVLESTTSPDFQSAKQSGASAVNNIMTVAWGGQFTVSGTVTAKLQITPLNAAAFPAETGNYASMTVICVFTN